MTAQSEERVNSLCDRLEKKSNILMWITGFSFVIMIGSAAGVGTMQGKQNQIEKTVEFMNSNYLPAIFINSYQRSMDLRTQEIIATLKPDSPEKEAEIKAINEKYQQFVRETIDDFQRLRNGWTSTTRGGYVTRNSNNSAQ